MFEGFHQRNFKITYGMQHRRNNRKNELLITNYEVEPPTPIDLLYA
jgi:DNA adenine methylase